MILRSNTTKREVNKLTIYDDLREVRLERKGENVTIEIRSNSGAVLSKEIGFDEIMEIIVFLQDSIGAR